MLPALRTLFVILTFSSRLFWFLLHWLLHSCCIVVMLRFPNFDLWSISIRFLAQNHDFDSIRFDSSYAHAKSFPTKFRDNRRWAVVFKATYCLYKTVRRLLIDVNSCGTYQQTTHCPWPVTNPPRISHLQTSKWQVTTMFPRSNLSRTTHQQHSQKLDAWHWRKLLLLANSSVNNVIGFSRLEITAVIHEIETSIIVYVGLIELSRVTCKLSRLRWTTNSHGGKHFGWQTDCGSGIAHCYVEKKNRKT